MCALRMPGLGVCLGLSERSQDQVIWMLLSPPGDSGGHRGERCEQGSSSHLQKPQGEPRVLTSPASSSVLLGSPATPGLPLCLVHPNDTNSLSPKLRASPKYSGRKRTEWDGPGHRQGDACTQLLGEQAWVWRDKGAQRTARGRLSCKGTGLEADTSKQQYSRERVLTGRK